MKPLPILGWTCCALLLTGLVGCSSGKSGKGGDGGTDKPRVAFVSNNPASFWSIAEAGAKKSATDHGVELFFQMPQQGEVAEQKEKIDQVLNQGIKAIAISVIDPENQNEYLRSISKRVTLLTQDNDAPESGRVCYIGTDNYEAGRAAGALVKQAIPEGGTIAIFVGQLSALNARQRRQGVIDELAGKKDSSTDDGAALGKYKLYKTYTDQPVGETKCKENAVQALTDLGKEANVCLVGLWAYNPPAILSAVKDQGKLGMVKIVAFDERPETLDAIKDGTIHGTIVQQPYEFGYRSIKFMSELIKGDKKSLPADGIHYVPHLAVTKKGEGLATSDGKKTEGRDAEKFHKQLNELLGIK